MNKLLLIIDPQVDFINGSLPVPGAEEAMDALARYIGSHNSDYARIIVTADRHPMRHCSFDCEGGAWPRHCVADSVGAAVWPRIMSELLSHPDKVTVLHKGEDPWREEYSIFKNPEAAASIMRALEADNIEQIDICGLAGDVCVADTICDKIAMKLPQSIAVLADYTPSIDGGATLDSIISENGLKKIERL